MMTNKTIAVTALCVFLLPVFLYGQRQQPAAPASLEELDRLLVEAAIRLDLRLRALPGEGGGQTPRISAGDFAMMDEPVILSYIWKNGILDTLAAVQNRTYILRDTAAPPGDYLLSGIILQGGNNVRITTRIVRTSDSSLIASWNSDLVKTPFVAELLEAAGDPPSVRRDRYETDSRENPVRVETGGEPVPRTIHNNSDHDFFLVGQEQRNLVTAETSGGMDTMMELYDEGGRTLSSNDDGGEGGNARIVFLAEAGKSYTVMVKGYDSETGSYAFRASSTAIPDQNMEPNDIRENAYPISAGELSAAFVPGGDIDWYRFEVPGEGANLIVSTGGNSDTFLAVYDGEGNLLAEDDDSGPGDNAHISINLPGGTVYIKANLYEAGSAAVYSLQTRIQPPRARDEWESDNSASRAKDITIGVPQTHSFSGSSDADWVKLTVTERGRYTIGARGVSDPDLDTVIELFDSDMDSIGEDDDGGERYDSRLSENLAPGVYYIKVTTLDEDPEDDYTLLVSVE